MKQLERVYHPVDQWEEIAANMWGDVADKEASIELAIRFTGDYKLYGSYMRRVVSEWPISCENALTDYYLNRRAWLGHAACAMAHRLPEDIVRAAWKELSDEQQLLANQEASAAIQAWEYAYIKDRGLCLGVGEQVLFKWDT